MKVLFVCTGNACRSPVAEALLKKFLSDIDVESAGTYAYYKIVDMARNYLRHQEAEQYLKDCPERLENKQLHQYDLIVAMEANHREGVLKNCPSCADKIVVWNIIDPFYLPVKYAEKVFNQIRQKTKELANSL
jgi:protein-tyrosine phosphatase